MGIFENSRAQTGDNPFMPSVSPSLFPNPEGGSQNPSRRFVKVRRNSDSQKGKASALGDSRTRVDGENIGASFNDALGLNSVSASQYPERNGGSFVKPGTRFELGVALDGFHGSASNRKSGSDQKTSGFSLFSNRNDENSGGSSSSCVNISEQVKGLRERVSGWNPFYSNLDNYPNAGLGSIGSRHRVSDNEKSVPFVYSQPSGFQNQSSSRLPEVQVWKEFKKLNIGEVGSMGRVADFRGGKLEVDGNEQSFKEQHHNVSAYFTSSAGTKQSSSVDAERSKSKVFIFGSHGKKISSERSEPIKKMDEVTDSMLPSEMRKLKLEEEMQESSTHATFTTGSKLYPTVELSKNKRSVFASSLGKTKCSGNHSGSGSCFSKNAYNVLPDEMCKLKIAEPAFIFKAGSSSNQTAGETLKEEGFVLGSNRERAKSSCEYNHSVREAIKEKIVLNEMRKLKIEETEEGKLKDLKNELFRDGRVPQTSFPSKATNDSRVPFSTVKSSAIFSFGCSHMEQETNNLQEGGKAGPSNEQLIGRADMNTTRQKLTSENRIGGQPFIGSVDGFKPPIFEFKAGLSSEDGSAEQNAFLNLTDTKAPTREEVPILRKAINTAYTKGSKDNSHHDFHWKSTPTLLDEFKEVITQNILRNHSAALAGGNIPVSNEQALFRCNIQDNDAKVNEPRPTHASNVFPANAFDIGSDARTSHCWENLVSDEITKLKLDGRSENNVFLDGDIHGSTTHRRSGRNVRYSNKGKNSRTDVRAAKPGKAFYPPSNDHVSQDGGMKEGIPSCKFAAVDRVIEPDSDAQPMEEFRPSTSERPCSSSTAFEILTEIAGSCSGSEEDAGTSKVSNLDLPKDVLWGSENRSSSIDKLFTFSTNGGQIKYHRPKKKLGRFKQPATDRSRQQASLFQVPTNSQEKSDMNSPSRFSPMDFSPYSQGSVGGGSSAEIPLSTGAQYIMKDSNNAPSTNGSYVKVHDVTDSCSRDVKAQADCQPMTQVLEEDTNHYCNQSKSGHQDYLSDGNVIRRVSYDANVADPQTTNELLNSKMASLNMESGGSVFSDEVSKLDNGNLEKHTSCFTFSSRLDGDELPKFTYSASPAPSTVFSSAKCNPRRKYWTRKGRGDHESTSSIKSPKESSILKTFPVTADSRGQVPQNAEVSHVSQYSYVEDSKSSSGINGKSEGFKVSTPAASYANEQLKPVQNVADEVLETCEKWRLRGNQAYGKGDFSKAEEHYTRGLNMLAQNATSKSCTRALLLCYSNRAAARLTLGRVGEALKDCMKAISIDPSFPRVLLRAANCYLALGHAEDALAHYQKCMLYNSKSNVDQKVVSEASNGLQKAKQLGDNMNQASILLQQKTSDAASNALHVIEVALSLSPYSDQLMKMKGEALLMLRKYEDVIRLCEQTIDSEERNSTFHSSIDSCVEKPATRIWHWCMISRCYFLMGKLEDAIDFFLKHDIQDADVQKHNIKMLESKGEFPTLIGELLRLKSAGNEAFQAGRHAEAIEYYSSALAYNIESRPFSAICFCNRAAAYQALNQITDAIADCSLAMAFDSNYAKAISRRATLHETIRDYAQASNDLQRLISLLQRQITNGPNETVVTGRSGSILNDLRQAQRRLADIQAEARKEHPLDIYLILAIDPMSTPSEVKKAYRKAALKHHPDKASQFLARNENGDDSLWKEIAEEVHKDAERLFKMIGEAHAIASDPNKRLQFDLEEQMRKAQKKDNASSPSQPSPASHSYYPFDKRSARRWRKDTRTHSNWSESFW